MPYQLREGLPYPQGATWDGKGTNFSLFSANATKVELCLFDSDGERELERIELPEFTNEIWHGYLAGVHPGTVYGYRVHGPYQPMQGFRFNHNKLLLDPYARELVGELKWNAACFGYTLGHKQGDLSFDTRNSAPYVPKSVVVDPGFDWRHIGKPLVPWDQTIIYEAHVKGFTKLHPDVYAEERGTFAGMCAPGVLKYIKSLGVTSVELMPVHAFINDQHLLDQSLTNYWGYNSIAFFALDPRFCSNPLRGVQEFKEMVARYHDAGIEIILDVVYNHTAEGNEFGPTLCFKGIDNTSYYRLIPESRRFYINDTGTGNTVNLTHPRVIQIVTDSLRYWVQEMNVDGFRFDLGTILSREANGFDTQSGFMKACLQDPILSTVKLIAEPWDCGPGGYQVGYFPPGWAEWNDKYRDTVRDFWRAQTTAAALSPRLYGSADLFNRHGRRPYSSINFITAHDGFTLKDLVSYNDRHNEQNNEGNKDGSSDNHSWNCGAEGETDEVDINTLRQRQMRNLLATLLLSQGTPMLLAGDEFARSQHGNNNCYCQDNELSWVDWKLCETNAEQVDYVRALTRLRATYPILRRSRFLSAEPNPNIGLKEVTWVNVLGLEMTQEDWGQSGACFGMLLDGRAQPTGIRQRGRDATLLIIFNAYHEAIDFKLPECTQGTIWSLLLDTNDPTTFIRETLFSKTPAKETYSITARSLMVFRLDTNDADDHRDAPSPTHVT